MGNKRGKKKKKKETTGAAELASAMIHTPVAAPHDGAFHQKSKKKEKVSSMVRKMKTD
jgi:hypothetical protein